MGHHRKKVASVGQWVVIASCVIFLAGMYVGRALKEPVEKRVVVAVPAPAPTAAVAKRARATLAQVRRDWGIEGRLTCVVTDPRSK